MDDEQFQHLLFLVRDWDIETARQFIIDNEAILEPEQLCEVLEAAFEAGDEQGVSSCHY